MIAVIDYDTGNLRSVANALGRLGAEYRITASPDEIRSAERVLLPGVGEASTAMEKLRDPFAHAARTGYLHRRTVAVPPQRGGRRRVHRDFRQRSA